MRPISKLTIEKKTVLVAQVVEHLNSNCETLSSNWVPQKQNKTKQKSMAGHNCNPITQEAVSLYHLLNNFTVPFWGLFKSVYYFSDPIITNTDYTSSTTFITDPFQSRLDANAIKHRKRESKNILDREAGAKTRWDMLTTRYKLLKVRLDKRLWSKLTSKV
jgi:hypothetical protein